MKDITNQFYEQYIPKKAILIYESIQKREFSPRDCAGIYVESYDIGENGNPRNAHPLTIKEMVLLSDLLKSAKELQANCFTSKELLPINVLHIETTDGGRVIWYTHAQKINLFFSSELGITNGKACVPALVWKADKENLSVFALGINKRPTMQTKLFHAPFFNVYQNGNVCMGTVDISVEQESCLEDFIKKWEDNFWNSYFSHLMDGFTPVKENIVLLWQELINKQEPFPVSVLKHNNKKLKNLLL